MKVGLKSRVDPSRKMLRVIDGPTHLTCAFGARGQRQLITSTDNQTSKGGERAPARVFEPFQHTAQSLERSGKRINSCQTNANAVNHTAGVRLLRYQRSRERHTCISKQVRTFGFGLRGLDLSSQTVFQGERHSFGVPDAGKLSTVRCECFEGQRGDVKIA